MGNIHEKGGQNDRGQRSDCGYPEKFLVLLSLLLNCVIKGKKVKFTFIGKLVKVRKSYNILGKHQESQKR